MELACYIFELGSILLVDFRFENGFDTGLEICRRMGVEEDLGVRKVFVAVGSGTNRNALGSCCVLAYI